MEKRFKVDHAELADKFDTTCTDVTRSGTQSFKIILQETVTDKGGAWHFLIYVERQVDAESRSFGSLFLGEHSRFTLYDV